MHRRQFLTLAPPLLLSPSLAPAAAPVSAKRLKVALIGTGWYGKIDLFRLLQVAEVAVVALCDADERQLDRAETRLRDRHPAQKKFFTIEDRRTVFCQRPLSLRDGKRQPLGQ